MHKGKQRLIGVGALAAFLVAGATLFAAWAQPAGRMPEFAHTDRAAWINSEPLTRADLKGKPVLLEVWTYG